MTLSRNYAKPHYGTYACGHKGEFYFIIPLEGKELEKATVRHLKRICPDCLHERKVNKNER